MLRLCVEGGRSLIIIIIFIIPTLTTLTGGTCPAFSFTSGHYFLLSVFFVAVPQSSPRCLCVIGVEWVERVAPHRVALCCSVGGHIVFTYRYVLLLLLLLLFLHSMLLHFPNSALNLKTTTCLNFKTKEVRLCENVTSGNENRRKFVLLAH